LSCAGGALESSATVQIVFPGMANDLVEDGVLLKLELDAEKS